MKNKTIKIDNRKYIEIYDKVLDFSEQSHLYEYVKNCAYKINRTASSTVPLDKQFKTLMSELNIYDLIKLNFFNNIDVEIIDRIKSNNYRLHRAYVNLSTAQDVYHYHVDSNIDEDFTILFYCNTHWEENWEGETHFGDPSGDEIVHSTSYKPNRLVLFSGTIPHKSSQPSFFAKDFRFVLTLKFTHPLHEQYMTDFPIADMLFDNNNNFKNTELEDNALSKLQEITNNIPHSGSYLFNHLHGTWKILKAQKRSTDICLAGMYHSIYGTEFYDKLVLQRDQIKDIIGESAEDIVFRFCSLQNRDSYLLDDKCNEYDLIHIAYANLLEEKFRNMSHEGEIISYKNKLIKIKAQ